MPSIVDEQLVQRELALPPPIIPGKMPWLTMLTTLFTSGGYGERRSGARMLNMCSRHAALSWIRSPLELIAPNGP